LPYFLNRINDPGQFSIFVNIPVLKFYREMCPRS